MLQPVVVKCGHTFCHTCMKRLIEADSTHVKCPICRAELDPGSLPPNVELMAIMCSLPATCKLCSWSGRVDQVVAHIETCAMKEMTCVFQGCSFRCLRKDINAHKRECPFRTVTCNECFDIVASRDLDRHTLQTCSHRQVSCPFYRDGQDSHEVTW